jgi:hypothetical protein
MAALDSKQRIITMATPFLTALPGEGNERLVRLLPSRQRVMMSVVAGLSAKILEPTVGHLVVRRCRSLLGYVMSMRATRRMHSAHPLLLASSVLQHTGIAAQPFTDLR